MSRPIRLDDSLDRAVAECFEGMVFTQVVRRAARSDVPGDAADLVWARIGIDVPAIGELILVVEEAVAQRLERGVIGAEGSAVGEASEMLGELLNALAGCWARILAPDANDLSLGLPKLGRGDWGGDAAGEVAFYETDEGETVRILRIAPPS